MMLQAFAFLWHRLLCHSLVQLNRKSAGTKVNTVHFFRTSRLSDLLNNNPIVQVCDARNDESKNYCRVKKNVIKGCLKEL